MHLAYVCSDLGVPVGGTKGASIHVRSLAQALAQRGHRISLLAASPGDELPADFLPRVHPVGYDRTLKRLKRRIAEVHPDSTKDREIYALMLGNLVLRRLETLHRQQPIRAIYERHSLWSWAALAFARERGIPHILEVNAPLVSEQETYRGLAMGDVAQACERELISGSDVVVVPSRALARHAERLGAKAEAVQVLPNAIDPALFEHPPSLPAVDRDRLRDRFVVAFVGSLKPWHGVDILVRAFERLVRSRSEAHLLVLGDGPERPRVERIARELGPERVTAPGAVDHREVAAWLRWADAGVAPYPQLADFYFSPLKVVEYQASALAVVASDIGHLRDQIDDGATGILVPPGDSTRLADTLVDLARDRDRARRIGERARRHVLRRHTWPRVARRVERLMERRLAAPVISFAPGRSR